VDIDLVAVREAAEHLGTRGLKETINAALRDVNRRAALERGASYLRERRDHPPPVEPPPETGTDRGTG
jgi:hypothetical protein